MRTSQARTYNPGTTPVAPVFADRPDCGDGPQCTWAFSVAQGKHYLKYINASCFTHTRVDAVRNGQRTLAA